MALVVVAICCLSLALIRSARHWRGYRVFVTCSISSWTPPYAPDFKTANVKQSTSGDFTVEAINARRAAAQEIHAIDNTVFLPDLFAYRCKVCSAVHAHWHDAFQCHKGGLG